MMDAADFVRLKQEVDNLKSENDRAAGALEEAMRRLANDFDCQTESEAEELLKKLAEQEAEAEAECEKAVRKFELILAENDSDEKRC